ncbi:MAG: DHH family phosphoesterase [Chloroflexi bacterium]|nr:DHH family phosphoesterase [Chloroflexota bacterium]
MTTTYVIGHINPDTDSIASALGYAWFLSQEDGADIVPARAGAINDQTAWVLEHLDLTPPKLLPDASPQIQNVTQRLDTITPDRPLREAWRLANRTGFVAPVVDDQANPISLITGGSLFTYLNDILGPELGTNSIELGDLFERSCAEAGDDGVLQFSESTRIRDALPRILRQERNEFWVVDDFGHYAGICRQRHLLNPPRLRLILVDHNESGQALGSLDEADVIEVLDHHRLGNSPTRLPIRFNVDIVGSTCTLVVERIEGAGLSAPPALAGLMLAGVISDTLHLSSPTTTKRDRKTVEVLTRWAFASNGPMQGESLDSFAEQVLHTGAGLSEREPAAVVRADLKIYNSTKGKFGIAQVEVTDLNNFTEHSVPLGSALDQLRAQEGLTFAVLMVTDIVGSSSRLLLRGSTPFIDEMPYQRYDDGTFGAEEVVSRKKQLLPLLLALVEN